MMPDTSATPSEPLSNPVEALKALAATPQRWYGANTQTLVEPFRVGTSVSYSSGTPQAITGTALVDVRALAERVMFDATVLVARLDESAIERQSQVDTVAVSAVLKGGAATTVGFALMCIVGNWLAGTVLLHPLLALSLIFISGGFYFMGRVKI